MKRDLNLVREILLKTEESQFDALHDNPTIDGYTAEQVSHHVYLMAQAGLVEAVTIRSVSEKMPGAMLLSVTWAGHDFIDAAKDNTLWNKVKSKVLTSGAAFTFDLLKEALVAAAKSPLGLQ